MTCIFCKKPIFRTKYWVGKKPVDTGEAKNVFCGAECSTMWHEEQNKENKDEISERGEGQDPDKTGDGGHPPS